MTRTDNGMRNDGYRNDGCDPCGDPCAPCEPCCVPKPKKCIDCECYSPAFYDLQCDWGVFLDAEFLYWYARETALPYAMDVQGVAVNSTDVQISPYQVRNLDAKWDPGFRIGLGWNSSCDGWDLYLNWTWYRNKKKHSTSVDPTYHSGTGATGNVDIPGAGQFALLDPWINTAFIQESSIAYPATSTSFSEGMLSFDAIKTKWRLQFNSIDLELGRKYWLSRCFTMRPYVGLRGAWTKTRFSVRGSRDFTTTSAVAATIHRSYRDRFLDRQWGVGLMAGFQPTFVLGCNFSIYGNLDAALIWGRSKDRKKMRYSETSTSSTIGANFNFGPTDHNSQFATMVPIVDLALGIRWEDTWCQDRYRSTLDLGWEHHVWFDFNHRYITNGSNTTLLSGTALGTAPYSIASTFQSFDVVNTNLYYGGFVLRLRFDF